MSKIASMMGERIDPIAQRKRVYWRPVTAATVIKVGQPVCYNSDEVKDYKERTTHPVTGTAYAAGSQDFNARFFCVEEPLTANLHHFAGIVAQLGPKAGADGDLIEIYVPNGAIVPVYTDIECTENQTLLGIRDGEADASYPAYQNIIGIAEETKDRSGTPGLVWAKIDRNLFIQQGDYSYPVIVTDECGGDNILNHIYVQSAQTSGTLNLMKIRGELTGAAGFGGGMFQIRAELNAAASDTCQALSVGFTVKASGELTDGGFTYCNSAIHAGIGTSGTPDMSGGNVACIACTYYPDESGGAPLGAWGLWFHSGATYKLDGLFRAFNAGDISDATVTTADITSQDSSSDKNIPIKLGTTTYYLRAFVNP